MIKWILSLFDVSKFTCGSCFISTSYMNLESFKKKDNSLNQENDAKEDLEQNFLNIKQSKASIEVVEKWLFANENQIEKVKESWWGKKFWNKSLVAIQGDGYWFTLNPIFDLRIGKDTGIELSNTFVNTTLVFLQKSSKIGSIF